MACDYLPNNDDIVRARKISTSMEEITFTKKMKKSVSTGGLDKYGLFFEKTKGAVEFMHNSSRIPRKTIPKGFSASKCDVGNWIFSKS